MSRHCGRFAEQAARLAAAQRKFLNAWKGVQAGGRARLPEARRARVALEEAFVLTRRALYQAWFPRDLPSVIDKTDYRQVDALRIGNMESRDFIVNEDDSVYVHHVNADGDSALYLWNQERTREAIDVTKQLPERIVTAFVTTPDGRVIVATRDDSIRGEGVVYQLTVGSDGSYMTQQELFRNDTSLHKIQPLYDGRILTGDQGGVLYLWTQGKDGIWESSFVGRQPSSVSCMQMMEDGRIFSGGELGDIILWIPHEEDESYESRIISWRNGFVNCLQGWHDGSVVSGYSDGFILLTTPRSDGSFYKANHFFDADPVTCLQRISDDRFIVGLWSGQIVQMDIVGESLRVAQVIGGHGHSSSEDILSDMRGAVRAQVTDLHVMEDGRMYSMGDDHLVRTWDGEPVDSGSGES